MLAAMEPLANVKAAGNKPVAAVNGPTDALGAVFWHSVVPNICPKANKTPSLSVVATAGHLREIFARIQTADIMHITAASERRLFGEIENKA